ncbi:unnamed protein product [Schistosoma margrebowiei]|uniref:Uncharacterized protein n=1 Tax=Schistosoma margrebowiei TaxID=48269 RepID=A0A183LH87_9TREM|nr:unnamed protein product [Schistosoma margrebowiei]
METSTSDGKHGIQWRARNQSGNFNLTRFFIAKDGQIYLGRSKLDRELYPLYELTVRVEDQGTPKLSSTTIVLIHILDVNDNTPQFIFPSIGNNTVYVRKETK